MRNFYKQNTSLLISIFGLFGAHATQAGPPFHTDDAEPVEYGHYEIFIAAEQTRTTNGSAGSRPLIEFNYGAAPDLQLSVGAPLAFDNPSRQHSQHGVGDVELSAKYQLVHETDKTPMISIFPQIVLATGDADKNLGNGASQIFLPAWLEKKWDDWQSYGGGGYWINRAAGTKNHWFFGWELQRRISDRWILGGEIFHSTEEFPGEGSSTGFNLGVIFDIDEHNHLLLSAGRGLTNIDTTNQSSLYVGYQLTW
jgi:hypothetical protein